MAQPMTRNAFPTLKAAKAAEDWVEAEPSILDAKAPAPTDDPTIKRKKKARQVPQPRADGTQRLKVSIHAVPHIWKAMRLEAVEKGCSVSDLLNALMERHLAKRAR